MLGLVTKKWDIATGKQNTILLQCESPDCLLPSLNSAAPYVKVYLLENGACIAKKKTKVARKTLDPLYQQQLPFEESPGGKVLQVRRDDLSSEAQ